MEDFEVEVEKAMDTEDGFVMEWALEELAELEPSERRRELILSTFDSSNAGLINNVFIALGDYQDPVSFKSMSKKVKETLSSGAFFMADELSKKPELFLTSKNRGFFKKSAAKFSGESKDRILSYINELEEIQKGG